MKSQRAGIAWRIISVFGEILITLGVLVVAYLIWQLWWTDIVAERQQREMISELSWSEPATPPLSGAVQRGPAPVIQEPKVQGELFATVYVPRWGKDYQRTIHQGIAKKAVLDELGIGHYPGTAMPGEAGNFALAGHRTSYGKPFADLDRLELGDAIVIRTETSWYVYRVSEPPYIVKPTDVAVIAPVPGQPDQEAVVASMTLTACHPKFSARDRIIVHAELDYWAPISEGTPAELGDTPDV